jgi:peptidoglycan/xylan/chitin deacetylase (PgdA/CDA1 family)
MKMHDVLRSNLGIWDLFTCKEEYENRFRDKHDRFSFYMSKNRDVYSPNASRYLTEHGFSIEYPNGAPFAVCLTHDADIVYASINYRARAYLKHLKQFGYSNTIRSMSEIRPLYTFSQIMDLEEQYGAKSTFFLMAETRDEQDFAYNIEDIETEIGEITDRGWEIGLHGGYTSYLRTDEMKAKKDKLEKVAHREILGYRNHFLRFRVPDSWEFLSIAGLKYDTTFGYADCVGFRNGMCHPFKPVNLNTGIEIPIIEIPLVIMDNTLLGYMRMNRENAWEIIKSLINSVERYRGVITILWHNICMGEKDLGLYIKILEYCKMRKACMIGCDNLYNLISQHGSY